MSGKRRYNNPNQLPLGLSDLDSSWVSQGLPELHGPQVWDLETWDPFLKKLGPGWAFKDRKTYGHVAGFAVAADNIPKGLYAPIRHEGGDNLAYDSVLRWARVQLAKPVPKIFAHATYDIGWLRTEGLDVKPEHVEDIQIQGPLLDEYRWGYSLDALANEHLHEGKDETKLEKALIAFGYIDKGKPDKGGISKLPARYVGTYAEADARLTRGVWNIQKELIEAENLTQINKLENSMVHVLISMRERGVRINQDRVEQLIKQWKAEMQEMILRVYQWTDVHVRAWDSKSITEALRFCGIDALKTSKGKDSIVADWLEGFSNHPDEKVRVITKAIGRLRKLDKAVNTFLKNFYLGHLVDGRVHVQFNALRSDEGGTISGRFSSSDFNMQQLPIRDEEIGPAVRSCVEPEEGKQWLAADYASQEPRLTVHWAVKAGFHSAIGAAKKYREDPETDYHQWIADICNIPRRPAKTINLGVAYGMGGPKLCRSLDLPTTWIMKTLRDGTTREIEIAGPEGQAILDKYNRGAPFIMKLYRMAKERGTQKGFIRTLFGRKCRFRKGPMGWEDARVGLNKLIQGSAADQMKETMRILFYEHGITPMVTVHDELGFSVQDVHEARRIVHLMENAVQLEVPTVVDLKLGPNWGSVEKVPRPQACNLLYQSIALLRDRKSVYDSLAQPGARRAKKTQPKASRGRPPKAGQVRTRKARTPKRA